ncbi:MAG: SsrA-binding protein [Patescibacteria group bacterium]
MKIINKKAGYEYQLTSDKYEAGIALLGAEAKSIRGRHLDLSQSTARILGGEAWLINANIPILQPPQGYNSTRMRKLLLHKDQIVSISTKVKQQKLTIVPTSIYNMGRIYKVGLALGKPKRKFEKREYLKKKDIEREIQKELKVH